MSKNKKSLWAEFREFINKGNVMDMAVGVIIGGAFKSIVDSLVNDLFMPLVSRVTGGVDFTNWFVSLDGNRYDTLAAAQEAGAATLNYGKFITVVLNFILLAFFVFLIVKAFNALRESTHKKQQEAPAARLRRWMSSRWHSTSSKSSTTVSALTQRSSPKKVAAHWTA